MIKITVTPKGRDAAAKDTYIYLQWFLRVYRKELHDSAEESLKQLIKQGWVKPGEKVKSYVLGAPVKVEGRRVRR